MTLFLVLYSNSTVAMVEKAQHEPHDAIVIDIVVVGD
jgi:hypothetical protein